MPFVPAATGLGLQPHRDDVLVIALLDVCPDDFQQDFGQGNHRSIAFCDLGQEWLSTAASFLAQEITLAMLMVVAPNLHILLRKKRLNTS